MESLKLKTGTIYGMTQKDKATFARDWHKVNAPVEYCTKVRVDTVETLENGDQYFTFVPVGFSQGLCGFGCTKLSRVKMVELSPAPPPPPLWYPRPGNTAFDLMC